MVVHVYSISEYHLLNLVKNYTLIVYCIHFNAIKFYTSMCKS